MIRFIFILLMAVSTINSFAQFEINKMERLLLDKPDSLGASNYKWMINVSGDYFVNSNSVTNSFVNHIYRREFIDESLKDRISDRLKKNNRLGADAYAGIQGAYKTSKFTYLFGVGHREFLGARFTSDAFELILRGNARYAGRSADLSKTNVRTFNYQSFYLGVLKHAKDGKVTYGASAAILRGCRYTSFHTKGSSSLYTDPIGEYVDLSANLDFSRYPRDSASYFKSKGAGAAINLFTYIQHGKNKLNIEIRDIGFITWRDVKNYSGDNTFRYGGIVLNDILDSTNSVVSTITLDSIARSMNIGVAQRNEIMWLPTMIHVNYMMMPNKKFSRTIGLQYMFAPGYIPRIYIRGADYLGKGFTLVNTVAYGGFGRFDLEVGMMKKIKDSFIISANLFAFEALVLPGRSSGQGINFGLTKLF